MDGRIGHLHCRFRLAGADAAAAGSRLERVAREQLAEAWSTALDRALGDDPTVYVLRRVEAAVAIGGEAATDALLAGRWGALLAKDVVRRIAEGDGDELVRFEDQADYVARFVADLLGGVAWERWYYGAFAALRARPRGEALRTALLDNREHLPAILRRLRLSGDLERLLRALDPATLRDVWGAGGGDPALDAAAARPIFAAAVDLVDRLQLWARSRPGEALFADYLATGPAPIDWREARGLAAAVVGVLRFLVGGGHVRRPPQAADPAFLARLDGALADLDWADLDWLRAATLEMLTADAGPPSPNLPSRSPATLTPKLRDLLADLLATLRAGEARLDATDPGAPANGLRWRTALEGWNPRWADDPVVGGIVERLLAAWAAVNHSRAPSALLRLVREGKVEEAVRLAGGALSALTPLLALGEPAVATVECLVADAEGPTAAARGFETECAGLFLLLRTIQDVRLPWVVRETNYPPVATDPLRSMLLALGRRWAGPIASDDPGLPLFVGLETLPAAGQLAVWKQVGAGDDRRFRRALFALLVDQRLSADERAWREPAALAAVTEGRVGRKGADRTLDLTAIALLRLWSRWLRHFAGSSAPYLLRTFIRRPGWILVDDETIVVEPAPKELDVVLELAGYFDPLEQVPWLGNRRVRFER